MTSLCWVRIVISDICEFVEKVHILTSSKGTPFKDHRSPLLPSNGIYLFFERGQRIHIKDDEYNRIVRIGINEKQGNFKRRIKGHYRGNVRGSVFRENIGWALLNLRKKEPKETYGTKRNFKKHCPKVFDTKSISNWFSKFFTFKAFNIHFEKVEKFEKILIAAFSIYYQYRVSEKQLNLKDWLGQCSCSRRDKIKKSGLWNSEHVILVSSFTPLKFGANVNYKVLSTPTLNMIYDNLLERIV